MCVQDAHTRRGKPAESSAAARFLDSFRLIAASPYLRHLCAFLTLNYVVSSFFYFERSLVVAAAARDAVGRTRMFAAINSASGAVIAVVQASEHKGGHGLERALTSAAHGEGPVPCGWQSHVALE